jgi:adenylate cyclase
MGEADDRSDDGRGMSNDGTWFSDLRRRIDGGRRVLSRIDRHPRLLAVADRVRKRLPGDPGYGDPLSVSGNEAPAILGQQLANLASRHPSALREFGLGALQVWQAYASSRPTVVGDSQVCVVFTDLGQFSSWTLEVGDGEALQWLREVSAAVEPLIAARKGELIKRLGDGLMIVFPDADEALEFLMAARDAVDVLARQDSRPRLRCGAHVGKPKRLGGDYFGADVNIAARVAAAAAPGEVLLSSTMHDEIDMEKHKLRKRLWFRAKGVPTDIRVYSVIAESDRGPV